MICLALLFTLMPSAKGSGAPWYPVLVPVRTEGTQHRHTTHVVTHPVVHTRVLVLGDDKQGQQSTKYGLYSERDYAAHRRGHRESEAEEEEEEERNGHRKHGGHSYDDVEEEHSENDYNSHSQPEAIRYSMLVSESPWKPLMLSRFLTGNHVSQRTEPKTARRKKQNHRHRVSTAARAPKPPPARRHHHHHQDHIPKGYLPLKYLGIDEARVAKVVSQALDEIEKDMEVAQHTTRPRYPTGIQDLIGRPRVMPKRPPELPQMYRGAVFYEDDPPPPPKSRYLHSTPGYVKNYEVERDPILKNALKLNVECQCQAPY